MGTKVAHTYEQIPCGHCGALFTGTKSQARHWHYDRRTTYCSPACLSASWAARRKPRPTYGPCPTCGELFHSRAPKIYCSLRCYTSSPQLAAMLAENRAKVTPHPAVRETRACLECGGEFTALPWKKTRFCCHLHYRQYMAKRFDRWVANPQTLALPQDFDEFLTTEQLPCLVEGCGWIGHHLSLHMNLAHGMPRDEFKRAAGFNKGTGVISPTLAERMRESNTGKGSPAAFMATLWRGGQVTHYKSLEGREHRAKARALAGGGPERECLGCGRVFQQSTPFGRARFCGVTCRTEHYRRHERERNTTLTCNYCEREFAASRDQVRRNRDGAPVYCSHSCKGHVNALKRKASLRLRGGDNAEDHEEAHREAARTEDTLDPAAAAGPSE